MNGTRLPPLLRRPAVDARKGEAKRKKRDGGEIERPGKREKGRGIGAAAKLTHAVTLERRPSPPFNTDATAVRYRPSTAADESLVYAARSPAR